MKSWLLTIAGSMLISGVCAQNFLKSEYTAPSRYVYKGNNESSYKGGMYKVQGNVLLPISVKTENSLTTMWGLNINGAYARLSNQTMAPNLVPDQILNVSATGVYLRPFSSRWSLLSTLGVGVYAAPDNITFKSILVNGGVVFIRRLKENLSLGGGLGITNAYGVPMAMPIIYLDWKTAGRYEVNVSLSGMSSEISAAAQLDPKLKLRLVALELDGMAAVMKVENKSMIYGTTSVKSSMRAEIQVSKALSVYTAAGANWERTATLQERTLKSFFNSLADENMAHFKPAFVVNAGVNHRF